MNDIRLYNVEMLYLLWFLPLIFALFLYSSNRRKQILQKFIGQELQFKLVLITEEAEGSLSYIAPVAFLF